MEFHLSRARYRGLISGIRGGKTIAGCIESLRLATCPGSEPGLGWVVAPDYPMLQDSTMRDFFRWCPRGLIVNWHKTDRILTLKDGNEIQFKSASEPDSLRGATLKWFWLDEAALCRKAVWDILLGRVLSTGGRGIMTTTPKGFNWVYDLVMSGNPGYFFVIFKSGENPYLRPEELERLYAQYSVQFARQELEASFEGFAGKVYADFRIDEHVRDLSYRAEWPLYRALDFGFSNPTVCLWIQTEALDRVHVIDEYYQSLRTDEENAAAILARERAKGYAAVQASFADAAAAGSRAAFGRYGIPTMADRRWPVTAGLELVRRALKKRADGKPGLLVDRRCANAIREFNSYRYADAIYDARAGEGAGPGGSSGAGRASSEEPLPFDNHAMDALRYFFVNWQGSQIESAPFDAR
jgi:phage terminase large subunit